MQLSVCISKCMFYWRLRACVRRSLEAVLAQPSDYSGILGHREIRPIGKTTGEKQRKYHSVVLMKQHREESWLSDLTLRAFKTNPGKVRETKLKKIYFICLFIFSQLWHGAVVCVCEINLLHGSIIALFDGGPVLACICLLLFVINFMSVRGSMLISGRLCVCPGLRLCSFVPMTHLRGAEVFASFLTQGK